MQHGIALALSHSAGIAKTSSSAYKGASYNAGVASANSFTGMGLNGLNSAGSQYGAISNYNMQGYGMQSQQTAAMLNAAGVGYAYRAADGREIEGPGHVTGPGSGISDSIPARLSDGEYVIPADVVKRKGVEFFDKLLDKHHMPAAEQKRRYGIGGR